MIMFGFLKDKLKGALGKFKKDVEKEAVVEKKGVVIEEKPEPKSQPAPKSKPAESLPQSKSQPEQKSPAESKPQRETRPEPEPIIAVEPAEKKEEKKGFFAKIFGKKEVEEQIEEKEELREKLEGVAVESIEESASVPQATSTPAPAAAPAKHKVPVAESKIAGVKITYFVHGTTTDNEEDLATGWEQGTLSKKGVAQSKQLPEQITDADFAVVFCSDLKRAIDSAELAFKGKYPIIIDKRLREADYGEYTRAKSSTFKNQLAAFIITPFPDGESYHDVEERMAEFLNELYDKYYGKHVAIVAHQAPQLALDVLVKRKSWTDAIRDDWRNTKAWKPGWVYLVTQKFDLKAYAAKKSQEKPVINKKPEPVLKTPATSATPAIVASSQPAPSPPKPVKTPIPVEEPEEKKRFFTKITETFTKFNLSEEKFEELFWDLEVVMLENNVAVEVIEKIKTDMKKELLAGKISRKGVDELIMTTLRNSIIDLFDVQGRDLIAEIKKKNKTGKPYIITIIGVNGSGKTTSIAKLTHLFQKSGLSAVLAASDTFRAAAIQQLEEHATRLNTKLIKHDYHSDPAAVAFDAIKYAEAKNMNVVIVDTAGRLHSNTNLMRELEKVVRVCNPDIKIFVGESITGNDCVEQAKEFDRVAGIDAIILAKADIDEKGGAAISVSYVTGKPILYLGTGQTYDDLKVFDANIIIESLEL